MDRQIYQHEAAVELTDDCKFLCDDKENKTKMATADSMRKYMVENSVVISSVNIPISKRKKSTFYLFAKAEPTVLGSDAIKVNQALGYRMV